jgi:hypothetical protein
MSEDKIEFKTVGPKSKIVYLNGKKVGELTKGGEVNKGWDIVRRHSEWVGSINIDGETLYLGRTEKVSELKPKIARLIRSHHISKQSMKESMTEETKWIKDKYGSGYTSSDGKRAIVKHPKGWISRSTTDKHDYSDVYPTQREAKAGKYAWAMEESMNEEMVEAPHGDPYYHANVHRELINRASGPQKEISLGAHIYRHLSTHPDESHITSHYEKTIYPILKKHGFPREDHGPVGPGHPRHDEHLRFHREFLPDVHKAWREMDKNNPHTAKLLSIADKEAKRKIAEREAEKEAKRQKGIEANKKRMNEEHRITEAHQWAIATPTKKGGWRRVPDTRFNDQNSAHAYGKKYHTSSIFGPQYKVIPHPDNLKEESMTEEHRITETNPGGEKTRYAVRKHGKSGKPIGQPTIFTTRRGAEQHIARLQKEDVMGGVPTNNMSSGAVADPKNKLLFKKPIKRFKSFTKE